AIQGTETYCGNGVSYVLLGYSSGAWLIHILLHKLPSTPLPKVLGVGLYGDPLYAPGLAIDRDYRLTDKLLGVAWAGDPNHRSVPKAVGSGTYDGCLPNDPICQAPNPFTLAQCINNDPACPHFRYVTDGVTKAVSGFLDNKLPSSSNWPVISSVHAPDSLVGDPYSWKPTVTPAASYTWSKAGTMPPGLKFSKATGALTGAPTKAGVYGFSVTATSAQLRTATQFEVVTINTGGPLSVTPANLPDATNGSAYKVTLSGNGGYLPYSWHATGTALTHGLQFTWINQDTSVATLAGVPDQTGSFSLSVTLTDPKGTTLTQSY